MAIALGRMRKMHNPARSGDALVSRLKAYSSTVKDYWSFKGNAAREHAHAYFQYPAMMVPRMQADLLNAALSEDPSIRHVYDPFAGSGTVLTESMKRGLDFTGQDINPLAVLLCRAKAIPHFDNAMAVKAESKRTPPPCRGFLAAGRIWV
jgi:hypothetical protein